MFHLCIKVLTYLKFYLNYRSQTYQWTEAKGSSHFPINSHSLHTCLCHQFLLITKKISVKDESKTLRIWSSPGQDHNGQFVGNGFLKYSLVVMMRLWNSHNNTRTALSGAVKKIQNTTEGHGIMVFLTMGLKSYSSLFSCICIFFWKPHIEYL